MNSRPYTPAGIGHNQPTFDEIVAENLRRGLYYTQRDVLISCIRDERLSQRHRLVLATIIEHMNSRDGMAYPGRRALAQSTSYYDHEWIERNYTEAGVSKTISELIDFGYLAIAKRAPEGAKRALTHYTIIKPSAEELRAEVSAYIEEIRRRERKPLPSFQGNAADLTPRGNVTPVGNISAAEFTPVVSADLTPVSPTVTSRGTRREERGETSGHTTHADASGSVHPLIDANGKSHTLKAATQAEMAAETNPAGDVAYALRNITIDASGRIAIGEEFRRQLQTEGFTNGQIDAGLQRAPGSLARAGSTPDLTTSRGLLKLPDTIRSCASFAKKDDETAARKLRKTVDPTKMSRI